MGLGLGLGLGLGGRGRVRVRVSGRLLSGLDRRARDADAAGRLADAILHAEALGAPASASCSAQVGSFQCEGGCTSARSEHSGFLHGALLGGGGGAAVGAAVGALVGAMVGATVGALVGWHAVQMPQVASQMPSFMLSRSGHRPSASCSAQVGSFQCEGGCTSTHSSEHSGFLHGALVGAIVGAMVGAAVGSSHGSSSCAGGGSGQLQMPQVHSQYPSPRLARSGTCLRPAGLRTCCCSSRQAGCTSAQPLAHGVGSGRRRTTLGAEVGVEVGSSHAVRSAHLVRVRARALGLGLGLGLG